MEERKLTAKDIMNRKVVSVSPGTPLSEAARLLEAYKFDGMPVVDDDNRLIGIVTEYDLISKGSAVHIPTMQFILQNLHAFPNDANQFREDVAAVSSLTAGDVMNADPLALSGDAAFVEVIAAFRDHHRVNPIPIVDKSRRDIGIICRFDLIHPLSVLR